MLGSSRHKSEWHWECSTDNERGHAAPLREERHCLGSLLSSGINLYDKLVCIPPSAIVTVRQWLGRKWSRKYVSWPLSVKVITLLNRNKRIFISWSSRLVSDLSYYYRLYFPVFQLQSKAWLKTPAFPTSFSSLWHNGKCIVRCVI